MAGETEPPLSGPPDELEGDEGDERVRRRRVERLLRDFIRKGVEKGIEAGLGTLSKSEEALREFRLPREIVNYMFTQVDETKNAMVRVVAREVRDFLQATDLSTELQKALTSLSFQVNTEIRFVPNENAKGGVRPEVKTRLTPRRGSKPPEAEPEPVTTSTIPPATKPPESGTP